LFRALAKFGTVASLLILTAGLAVAREPLSNAQVRDAIIRYSIARYQAQPGHPCACPYNVARNGSRQCGVRVRFLLHYERMLPPPLCSPKDINDSMVADWRRRATRQ